MNKVTNKLASGIRKVKEQQATPAVADKQAERRPAHGKAEQAVNPGCIDRGGFVHPPRVWPD